MEPVQRYVNGQNAEMDASQPMVHQIRIRGHLGHQWTEWFEGLTITLEANGDTLLTGSLADQSALYGLLKKLRDLGLPLLSLKQVEPGPFDPKGSQFQKGEQMNANMKVNGMEDMQFKFQTLWIFAILNYLYCDVLGLHDAAVLKMILGGQAGSLQITEGFLFAAAVLMETAIVMVLLSRVLRYRANRWANIIAGLIHTAAVSSSMFVGRPASYYMFFGALEVACTLFIVWTAWKWSDPEASLT